MKKEFITYEQALALKELGFDEPCLKEFHNQNLLNYSTGDENTNSDLIELYGEQDVITAPLYQQAFRWLKERYKLLGYIMWDGKSYYYQIQSLESYENDVNQTQFNLDVELTYEEAEQTCLDKLIEIIKNKQD